ncbi:hypothetical protein FACS189472_09480 [Alphaproteobacteria bacterium]|nr:hypothetical protein FACS189472_09480 [Alphaproteobacteria bacterium]
MMFRDVLKYACCVVVVMCEEMSGMLVNENRALEGISLLSSQASNNMDKMKELVEILCDQKTTIETASDSLLHFGKSGGCEQQKQERLLYDLCWHKKNSMVTNPNLLWARYNDGTYDNPFWEEMLGH